MNIIKLFLNFLLLGFFYFLFKGFMSPDSNMTIFVYVLFCLSFLLVLNLCWLNCKYSKYWTFILLPISIIFYFIGVPNSGKSVFPYDILSHTYSKVEQPRISLELFESKNFLLKDGECTIRGKWNCDDFNEENRSSGPISYVREIKLLVSPSQYCGAYRSDINGSVFIHDTNKITLKFREIGNFEATGENLK